MAECTQVDRKPVKRIRSLAQAEQVLREWQRVYAVGMRLDPHFNVISSGSLADRAHRAYLYIRRHEHKHQQERDTWQ